MRLVQRQGLPPDVDCQVDGILVDRETAQTKEAWFSVARRSADGVMSWALKSPFPALLWMRHGFRRFSLNLGGGPEHVTPLLGPAMVFVPGGVDIAANFLIEGEASYTLVLFTPSSSMYQASPVASVEPMVNFRHRELEQSLASISREVARPDNLFDMLAEGWTLQALAHLSRQGHNCNARQPRHVGGLSRTNRVRLEEYIRVHLCDPITLDDLAQVVGLTTRHLNRAFRASFAETPMQYIVVLRAEKAARMLIETRVSITQVALDCGFNHPQHFAASFSRTVGCSPSEFRRQSVQGGTHSFQGLAGGQHKAVCELR